MKYRTTLVIEVDDDAITPEQIREEFKECLDLDDDNTKVISLAVIGENQEVIVDYTAPDTAG